MTQERVEGKMVTMYPEQWAVLHQLAKDLGLGSVSAANRYVISEFVRMKSKQLRLIDTAAAYEAR